MELACNVIAMGSVLYINEKNNGMEWSRTITKLTLTSVHMTDRRPTAHNDLLAVILTYSNNV